MGWLTRFGTTLTLVALAGCAGNGALGGGTGAARPDGSGWPAAAPAPVSPQHGAAPTPGTLLDGSPASPARIRVPGRRSLLTTVLFGAGGAVLGGWAGYMTSQIVWSDWQRVSRPGGINRLHYTLTGAGIGAVVGAVIGRHSPSAGTPGTPVFGLRPAITTEQIEASATRTVQELILLLRPQWLNPRGSDLLLVADSSAQPPPPGSAADVIRVYLDGELLGGPDELAEIPTPQVLRVEYYDMKAATLRWGAGHSHGAINVITGKGQH